MSVYKELKSRVKGDVQGSMIFSVPVLHGDRIAPDCRGVRNPWLLEVSPASQMGEQSPFIGDNTQF